MTPKQIEAALKVIESAKLVMEGYVRPRIVDQSMSTSIRLKRADDLMDHIRKFDLLWGNK